MKAKANYASLTRKDANDTISPSTATDGDVVQVIATIRNKEVFNRWGNVNPIVVMTDERIAHILEGHLQDYTALGNHITEAIESPTYILEDYKNVATALFVKCIEKSNLNVVVRLKIEGVDADDLQSSVITMYRLGEKTLTRMLKINNVLYRK